MYSSRSKEQCKMKLLYSRKKIFCLTLTALLACSHAHAEKLIQIPGICGINLKDPASNYQVEINSILTEIRKLQYSVPFLDYSLGQFGTISALSALLTEPFSEFYSYNLQALTLEQEKTLFYSYQIKYMQKLKEVLELSNRVKVHSVNLSDKGTIQAVVSIQRYDWPKEYFLMDGSSLSLIAKLNDFRDYGSVTTFTSTALLPIISSSVKRVGVPLEFSSVLARFERLKSKSIIQVKNEILKIFFPNRDSNPKIEHPLELPNNLFSKPEFSNWSGEALIQQSKRNLKRLIFQRFIDIEFPSIEEQIIERPLPLVAGKEIKSGLDGLRSWRTISPEEIKEKTFYFSADRADIHEVLHSNRLVAGKDAYSNQQYYYKDLTGILLKSTHVANSSDGNNWVAVKLNENTGLIQLDANTYLIPGSPPIPEWLIRAANKARTDNNSIYKKELNVMNEIGWSAMEIPVTVVGSSER